MNIDPLNRIIGSAALLGRDASSTERFVDDVVLLTGDAAALATANGQTCFEAALELLPRTCRNTRAWIPEDIAPAYADLRTRMTRHALGAHLTWLECPPSPSDRFAAVLHVGDRPFIAGPLTTIHSDG